MLGEPGIPYNGQGGAGGCFRTKHQRSERDRLPVRGDGELALGVDPAAFGTDQQGDGIGALRGDFGEQGRGRGFVQEVAVPGCAVREALVEAHGGQDFRDAYAARLLAAFARDALPAFAAFARGVEEALFAARGGHRKDAVDAEFGGLFDDPLEAVELDDAGAEGDGDGRQGGGQGFDDAEGDVLTARLFDFGEVGVAIVGESRSAVRVRRAGRG